MTSERMAELKLIAKRDRLLGECLEAIDKLQAAIRAHRDRRGDDRCWLDDETLYKTLPEGYSPPARSESVELDLCRQFIATRHHPSTQYTSPQRRIEELEARWARLQAEAMPLGTVLETRVFNQDRMVCINCDGTGLGPIGKVGQQGGICKACSGHGFRVIIRELQGKQSEGDDSDGSK